MERRRSHRNRQPLLVGYAKGIRMQVGSHDSRVIRFPVERTREGRPVIFYKRYIGDYIRDTAHLSLIEHGVYSKLLDVYYAREAPLPVDQVARLLGAKARPELEALQSVLAEFFYQEGDYWRHKRCDAEIAAAQAKAKANRNNGKRGGRPKRGQTEPVTEMKPTGLSVGSEWDATQNPQKTLVRVRVREDSEELKLFGADAPSGSGPEAPETDPTKALWDIGVSILGDKARSAIGQAIKRVGHARVGEVLGQMAVRPPVDPMPYFQRATQSGHSTVVV